MGAFFSGKLVVSLDLTWNRMLLNSVSAAHHSKANTLEASVGWKRKICFIQEVSNLGRKQACVPEPTLKILYTHESF